MKSSQQSPFFGRLFLTAFAAIGTILISYYLFSEINRPEYLVFYAPIFGLLLFGIYYIIIKNVAIHFRGNRFNGSTTEG